MARARVSMDARRGSVVQAARPVRPPRAAALRPGDAEGRRRHLHRRGCLLWCGICHETRVWGRAGVWLHARRHGTLAKRHPPPPLRLASPPFWAGCPHSSARSSKGPSAAGRAAPLIVVLHRGRWVGNAPSIERHAWSRRCGAPPSRLTTRPPAAAPPPPHICVHFKRPRAMFYSSTGSDSSPRRAKATPRAFSSPRPSPGGLPRLVVHRCTSATAVGGAPPRSAPSIYR